MPAALMPIQPPMRHSTLIRTSLRNLWFVSLFLGAGIAAATGGETALRRPFAAPRPLPYILDAEFQPLAAQVRRLIEAAEIVGEPFSGADKAALDAAFAQGGEKGAEAIQAVLDPHCLFAVDINPEMRVKATQGPAEPKLVAKGWRSFLVKVANASGTTAPLRITSPNALSVHNSWRARTASDEAYAARWKDAVLPTPAEGWLDLQTFDLSPMKPTLGGMRLEYRIVQLYSRDAGAREARFNFDVGEGTQDLGFRNDTDVTFACAPAESVKLRVLDETGAPTTAAFLIRDPQGRVYPSTAKRLAPDFAFQSQVYHADGETLELPHGRYTIRFWRGPESIPETREVTIGPDVHELSFQVRRWIDPSEFGWWSGDHHIHAAGCAHYTKPTEGVLPEDMMRQVLGEDLKVGANLTWGPCFDYQKQFFCGYIDRIDAYPYLLHYDIEVSGFGSHKSGHLVLLELTDQMYPGCTSTDNWPTLGMNTIRWAKAQGALVGYPHSGLGLRPDGLKRGMDPVAAAAAEDRSVSEALPNYIIPPFDGVGANEYIVDVTHEVPGRDGKPVPAVDFISLVDTPHTWELNIWYQTLNAGFRTRASGETDFPCLSGERVGVGRSYVKIDGKLSYAAWCDGIRNGRAYVSDGKSHLMDFRAGGIAVGEQGSELRLAKPQNVTVTARVAALLDETPDPPMQNRPARLKPFWDVERARIGATRDVPVEVIVNGESVARQAIRADGQVRDVTFQVPIECSSWIALRIRASSHTNPIFVVVDGKPIRPSRRSIEWCLKCVDQCWSQKKEFIAPAELDQARADYEHAREVYRRRLAECEGETRD